ncbi:MAG: helix-turn-helix domain-containing protein [Ligilactobacillus animalis]|uniref:helix-turn-helix domain-containing protein n=1 Tax=Ligilactobacillus animalis TaxID=1605 RepID=UPI00242E434E|nr:helix-turn-helix domain-containing protein [Ligilactobacillus animalis]MCI5942937.1 helix-turn-helix domain-containing protein [Ligilactobacillus animalis]MDY2993771.1 helix-turn-helix domain-containing protein [Ligilactobacillus animalis]
MEQPSYYSVTPATVRYDRNLKPNEKLLYGEITALANVKGYCYASNSYFAKLYDVKPGTVSGWVTHLKKLGYVDVQTIYKENSKEIQERRIYINDTPTRNIAGVCDKNRIPPTINIEDPMRYKSKENNTSINTTSKNRSSSKQLDETNAFVAYQLSGATLNGKTMEIFTDYVHRLGNDLVCHAIDIMSVQASHPNFSFLQKILDGYEDAGITTVEQAVEAEKLYKDKKRQRQNNWSNRRNNSSNEVEWYE